MFVIGTAGHIDHGKSTLVQALTGINPDRLREERERGMTIDLGFAWLRLPGIEGEVSIVDVPGHERFIKNMLAGVGGIDLALLVIAADEGVMPQTREHLAILDLLDVRSGVVAITKIDLVEPDWLELVQADIEETLAGTTLAEAPLVPVSAVTGAGLDELRQTLAERLRQSAPRRDIGRPRLPIDRAFTIAGFGTVVTGTLIDGTLTVGQEVAIEPGGLRARIRGLQAHKQRVERALPGSRTAVNLAGVSPDDLRRGMVLCAPSGLQPTTVVDARLTVVRDLARPLRHNTEVTFHTGAAEVSGRVRLLDADALDPGQSGWAQIKLFTPVAVVRGDRFVLRSPNETLAGGTIVDTAPRRHRRKHAPTLATLAALAQGAPEDRLLAALAQAEPADLATLAARFGATADDTRALLDRLAADGRIVAVGEPPLYYTRPGYDRLTETARQTVAAFLGEHPLRSGMPREELKRRLEIASPRLFASLAARWHAEGLLEERGATVSLPGYAPTLPPRQRQTADAFLARLRAQPFAPPADDLPDRELLGYLAEAGLVVPVAEGIVFDAQAYRQLVAGVVELLRTQGTVTLAQVRDRFNTSRRYVQALLEHLDERHVTRRIGDERVLQTLPPELAAEEKGESA